MSEAFKIIHYERNGHDIFQDWLDGIKDLRAKTAIARIVKRVEKGNFGEHRSCRNGVWELVINIGQGYRVYYSIVENTVVLLLCAGDKRTQQKDINKAIEYLQEFKKRN